MRNPLTPAQSRKLARLMAQIDKAHKAALVFDDAMPHIVESAQACDKLRDALRLLGQVAESSDRIARERAEDTRRAGWLKTLPQTSQDALKAQFGEHWFYGSDAMLNETLERAGLPTFRMPAP